MNVTEVFWGRFICAVCNCTKNNKQTNKLTNKQTINRRKDVLFVTNLGVEFSELSRAFVVIIYEDVREGFGALFVSYPMLLEIMNMRLDRRKGTCMLRVLVWRFKVSLVCVFLVYVDIMEVLGHFFVA